MVVRQFARGVSITCLLASALHSVRADDEFNASIAPFLRQHCIRCHGVRKQEGRLSLQKLTGKVARADRAVWQAILTQLNEGTMPPDSEPQPNSDEVNTVNKWIHDRLSTDESALSPDEMVWPEHGNLVPHELLFETTSVNDDHVPAPATPVRIWRVRPSIYESFVERASREPFHHPFKRESLFSTPWGLDGDSFRDYSALYWIGEPETELLMANAMRVASLMSHKRSAYSSESKVFRDFLWSRGASSERDVATMIDTAFEQILKREPTGFEVNRYSAFLRQNVDNLGKEVGLQTTLAALLLHPGAVFRFELGHGTPDEHGRVRLAPAEMAYAIAFAVTDHAPDSKLMEAARDGKLESPAEIRRHARRLIDEQQAKMQASYRKPGVGRRFTAPMLRFFQEYFGYTEAPKIFKDQATRRKARLGGNYSPEALVSDTNLLVLYLIDQDRDVLRELLTTNLSFVSTGRGRWNGLAELKKRAAKDGLNKSVTPFDDKRNRINEHYNITPEQWSENMPFPLDKTQRAGILTQPSWLIAHSINFENHAIHRGKWIRERLPGDTIPNTPITVDAQLPDNDRLTLRERMQVTRESFCWKCHQKMDPLGLPFEMFDHFGRHRTTELGQTVVSTGRVELAGDRNIEGTVDNAVELVHRLASSRRVQQVFIRHAFRFFMGRNETAADAPTLIEAERACVEHEGSMKAIVASLLSSDSFVFRKLDISANREEVTTDQQSE